MKRVHCFGFPTHLIGKINIFQLSYQFSLSRSCRCDMLVMLPMWRLIVAGHFFQKKTGRFPKTFQIEKKIPILSKIFPRYRKTIHSSSRVCCFRFASSVSIWTCLWVLSQHLLVEGLILCHGFREGIFKCNSCKIHRPYPYRQKTTTMPPVL